MLVYHCYVQCRLLSCFMGSHCIDWYLIGSAGNWASNLIQWINNPYNYGPLTIMALLFGYKIAPESRKIASEIFERFLPTFYARASYFIFTYGLNTNILRICSSNYIFRFFHRSKTKYCCIRRKFPVARGQITLISISIMPTIGHGCSLTRNAWRKHWGYVGFTQLPIDRWGN